MRILFTSFPAYGHVHPLVPLAFAAIERGDEVLVAIGPDFSEWITDSGLAVAQTGRCYRDLSAEAKARFPGPAAPAHLFTTVAVPSMAKDLLELSRAWQPDLFVHEEAEHAAPSSPICWLSHA